MRLKDILTVVDLDLVRIKQYDTISKITKFDFKDSKLMNSKVDKIQAMGNVIYIVLELK